MDQAAIDTSSSRPAFFKVFQVTFLKVVSTAN